MGQGGLARSAPRFVLNPTFIPEVFFTCYSDSKLYEWGLYGKPGTTKDTADLDRVYIANDQSTIPSYDVITNQSDEAYDSSLGFDQSELTGDVVIHQLANKEDGGELSKTSKDHEYASDGTSSTLVDGITHQTSADRNDTQTNCGRRGVSPYVKPSRPFQGEIATEEEIMKGMGLPLSFVRSPQDFDEVS